MDCCQQTMEKAVQGPCFTVLCGRHDRRTSRRVGRWAAGGQHHRHTLGEYGYHLGEKKHWEKFALWENTTHVPLIVYSPQHTKPNTKCENPVSLLDLFPTLVELCGLKSPPQKLEGQSFVDLLLDPDATTERMAITTQGKDNHSVRSRQHRYIRYADGSEELYDHGSDPHEWTNLASDDRYAATKKHLAGFLPKINAEPLLPPKKSDTLNRSQQNQKYSAIFAVLSTLLPFAASCGFVPCKSMSDTACCMSGNGQHPFDAKSVWPDQVN